MGDDEARRAYRSVRPLKLWTLKLPQRLKPVAAGYDRCTDEPVVRIMLGKVTRKVKFPAGTTVVGSRGQRISNTEDVGISKVGGYLLG